MAFREIDQRHHKFWLSVEFLKVYVQKNLEAIILFVDFSKAFDSINKEKMEQIFLAYYLPKETVAAIMILYKNTKVKFALRTETDYFDMVVSVLQGETIVPYLFIFYLDYLIKQFQAGKGKKLKIPRTDNYGRGLRRWHGASGKHTHPSRIPAT